MNAKLVMVPGDDVFDLEDAAAGVHHLIAPLDFLAGPSELDGDAVRGIAGAVESLSARTVHGRLASSELAALPPFNGRALADDDKEWLLAVLQGVMVFMRRAATAGASVIVARS